MCGITPEDRRKLATQHDTRATLLEEQSRALAQQATFERGEAEFQRELAGDNLPVVRGSVDPEATAASVTSPVVNTGTREPTLAGSGSTNGI